MVAGYVKSLLVVIALGLSLATSASAECAWVVWRQNVGRESVEGEGRPHEFLGPWAILDTASTQAQCEVRLKAYVVREAFRMAPSPNQDKEIKDATQGRENMLVFLLTKDGKTMASQDGANISLRRFSDEGLPTEFNYLCLPDTVDPRASKSR